MLSRRSQSMITAMVLADGAAAGAAWLAAFYARLMLDQYNLVPITTAPPQLALYLQALPVVVIVTLMCLRAFRLYDASSAAGPVARAWGALKGVSLAMLVNVALGSFVIPGGFSRLVFLLYGAILLALIAVTHYCVTAVVRRRMRKPGARATTLIVGAGALGRSVLDTIRKHDDIGVEVVGFCSRHNDKVGQIVEGLPVFGTDEEVRDVVEREKIREVIIALPLDAPENTATVIGSLYDATCEVKVVPDIMRFAALRGTVDDFDGLPVIGVQTSPLLGYGRYGKRAFDIAFAGAVLLLGSPVFIGLALATKISSPGPVFYRQRRTGLDGREFEMLKYRSMSVNAEAETGPVWAKENDDRRTGWGSFIRKTSLDELPQFINVLLGDMSVVGPRPERPIFIEKFRKTVPRYNLRHKARAGITGWAQINGLRGNTSIEDRIEFDLYYIQNWSFWFDLKIIILTVLRGFGATNAY